RRAERLAKTISNALAVIVDKRSGPEIETHGHWRTADRDLARFVELHWNDWVPDGAAYELRELARLLAGTAGEAGIANLSEDRAGVPSPRGGGGLGPGGRSGGGRCLWAQLRRPTSPRGSRARAGDWG